MPINTLQYSQQFQTVLDAQMLAGATTAFMEANLCKVLRSMTVMRALTKVPLL